MAKIATNYNLPNSLTVFRILLLPAIVLFFYLPLKWAHLFSAFVFSCGALTDWFDGYLARSLKQTTKFGAFLDPVADKLMVAIALMLVVGEFGSIYITLPALIIIGREIVVSALREWMAELGKRTSLAVNRVTKIKTAIQMVALILLLLYSPGGEKIWQISGMILLYIAAILTLSTMVMYLKTAWPDLTLMREK